MTERFISSVCQWAYSHGCPKKSINRLPSALRRFTAHVENAECQRDVEYRMLPSPFEFPIVGDTKTAWVYTTGNQLVFGAVGPAWRGFRSISKDEIVIQSLSDFAHFAGQYITRSRLVKAQAALALLFGEACDFRYCDLNRMTTGLMTKHHDVPSTKASFERNFPRPSGGRSRRHRELQAWMELVNPLDPYVHRALYQFWRATALQAAGFWEDVTTSLDGVVAVVAEALCKWNSLALLPSRSEAAARLGMNMQDQRKLDLLYKLRCQFGAHPPPTKWWDFEEIYGEELEEYPLLVARVLRHFCTYERAHRRVDSDPVNWTDWFSMHSELLLEAIWFTKLPD